MIIEYKGQADRQVGTGTVHEVRAFWNSMRDDEGVVKRDASKAVRDVVGKSGSVTFESWDLDTFKSPSLAAIVRVRVLTDEQVERRKRLKAARYDKCGICTTNDAGQLVLWGDGSEQPLCYICMKGLGEKYQVVHYIKADGRLQLN